MVCCPWTIYTIGFPVGHISSSFGFPVPELPEVETIARKLRDGYPGEPSIVGRTILGMEIRWPRHISVPAWTEISACAEGQTVRAVSRRGKFLVLSLTRDTMLIHLRMSGDLCVAGTDEPLRKHDLTIWHLSGGVDLRFHDPRRFGRVWLMTDPAAVLGPLGPEPLASDFTARRFSAMLESRRRILKPLLLDQTFLAGMGNIYTDEALHRARLRPTRHSDTLKPDEISRLWRSIRAVLREGIRRNGASIDWVYRGGGYQHAFRVYGRDGEACGICGRKIRRRIVGQRSSYFCPFCQH
jgi:formamidopyrimidine-DNA glycosylase